MDDTYIKMVLALPDDFFEGLELKDGDAVLYEDEGEWKTEYIGTLRFNDGVLGFDAYSEEFYPVDWSVRLLPSQEQLQELIRQHNKTIGIGMYDYCLITQIGTWCYRQPTELVQDKDINCLTLMFYMWLKDKSWNGSEWV